MGKVVFNMSVSLDGFIAGPNDEVDQLFGWYFSGDTEVPMGGDSQGNAMVLKVSPESAKVLEAAVSISGAMVCGRRTFNVASGWGGNPPITPCFVLTHTIPQEWVKDGSPFTFVTDGIESAIRQASKAAGDKDVVVSTASTLQQSLKAGLLDEINIDLVPVLLGNGIRLFEHLGNEPVELKVTRVVEAPGVTHLQYAVVK